MFNKLEDVVRKNILDILEKEMQGDHPEDLVVLKDEKELSTWLRDKWLQGKPWWYPINMYHKYEADFKEVIEYVKGGPLEIDKHQDLRTIVAWVLLYQIRDLIHDSDFMAPSGTFYFVKPLMQELYTALENV